MSDTLNALLAIIGSVTVASLLAARYGWRCAERSFSSEPVGMTIAHNPGFQVGHLLYVNNETMRITKCVSPTHLEVVRVPRRPWWAR